MASADDDDLQRQISRLRQDHDLTRWYTGRIDRDLAQIGATQAEHTRILERLATVAAQQSETLARVVDVQGEHTEKLDRHDETLQAHTARFDSVDAQLRSLTLLVGQVLTRMPPEPGAEKSAGE